MKLSEMNTREMAAALCKLTPAVERIVQDDALGEAMRQFANSKEKTPAVAYAKLAALLAPVLLDKHLDDTVTMLSALTGKDEAVIYDQPGWQTIKDIKGCLDKDLLDFFMPSAGTEAARS